MISNTESVSINRRDMKALTTYKRVAVLVLMLPTFSFAYVVGGSNLSLSRYPEFDDYPPSAPYSRDEWNYRNYRAEVEQYVQSAEEYVENARNDQKRAGEAAEEAIEKANQAIEEFNAWARRGY